MIPDIVDTLPLLPRSGTLSRVHFPSLARTSSAVRRLHAAVFACFLFAVFSPRVMANESERLKLEDELVTAMRMETTFFTGWTSYPPVDGGADHVDSAE